MDKLHFPIRTEFDATLRQRVDDYLKTIKSTGSRFLHIKAVITFAFVLFCYFMLMFECQSVLSALLFTFLMVQGKIILAFNVMHDGNHGSFSSKKWLNDLAGKTMDFLGSSSMLWKQKHNTLHHTYTNIDGKDDDLDVGGLIRLSPTQKRQFWHKYQHIYAPFLYGFLSLHMLVVADFQKMITGKIGQTPLMNRNSKEVSKFIISKIIYLTWMLAIPMIWHSPLAVIGLFLFGHLILGFTLSVIFQLAHTVNETSFPQADENNNLPFSWVEHQLHTTANFAPKNWLVTFYCGGLNYQIEHHLFHRVSHVHYPKLSKIIKSTCEEFGKPYHVNKTFGHAFWSHLKFLKKLGHA